MTCPRCHTEFEDPQSVCPECGIRLLRNISGVIKTSAVLIDVGEERVFYRSVQEVPEPLRTRLMATTTSANSGTIVIADRAGKEQLTQVMARREAAALRKEQQTLTEADTETEAAGSGEPDAPAMLPLPSTPVSTVNSEGVHFFGVSWLAWAGLIFVLAVAAVIASLFGLRW